VDAEWNAAVSFEQLTSAGVPLHLVESLVLTTDLERFDDMWPDFGRWTGREPFMPSLRKLVVVLDFSASSSLVVRDEKRAPWEAEGSELLRKLLEPMMVRL